MCFGGQWCLSLKHWAGSSRQAVCSFHSSSRDVPCWEQLWRSWSWGNTEAVQREIKTGRCEIQVFNISSSPLSRCLNIDDWNNEVRRPQRGCLAHSLLYKGIFVYLRCDWSNIIFPCSYTASLICNILFSVLGKGLGWILNSMWNILYYICGKIVTKEFHPPCLLLSHDLIFL